MKPKFDECESCRFFIARKRHTNPICRECGNGEFFEPKTLARTPTNDELMSMFERMQDDN